MAGKFGTITYCAPTPIRDLSMYSSIIVLLLFFLFGTSTAPKLGDDGVVSEAYPLPDGLLPTDVGLRKQTVVYSCLDASQSYLVVGSMQGYVWVVDLKSKCVLKEFNVS